MELYVRACRFYPEISKEIPIAYNPSEKFDEISGLGERLRVILVQKGTGILSIDDKKISIVAPAVLCINEKESVHLVDSVKWDAQSFYFHPQFINYNFTFEKIRGNKKEFAITEKQETFLLDPFIERNDKYIGQLNIDSASIHYASGLFDSIRKEIEEQSHRLWSCRARSYFIELLFTLARAYSSPEEKSAGIVINSSETVDKIILYLNSNYSKKITIPELCTLFNTNKTTIQEQFQNATGQPIMAYLISLRVKLATLMLKDTGLTISEIVERLGFSDNAHFNKMFKKLIGYSPNQYRKQFTWIGK